MPRSAASPRADRTRLALAGLWTAGLLAPAAALDYVESSVGLDSPGMEAGRTELEFGDVNGDGNVDLVSVGDHGSPFIGSDQHGVSVWFGDGTGSWSVSQYGNFGYGGVALGDVNGDGLMDVGYGIHHNYSGTDLGDQLLEVALGDGTGTLWTPWDDGLATAGETWGMFGADFADIDGDGDLDVGSVSFGCCSGIHVYRNDGDGTWEHSFGVGGGNSAMDFVFGDVNADGIADFAVSHESSTVYRGDGEGGFAAADANLPPDPWRGGPDLGDVDGDGRDDLSFAPSAGGVQVWAARAGGNWEFASIGLPTSGDFETTQLHDLDGDGWIDLAAMGDGRVTVWIGDGSGAWTEAAGFSLASPGRRQAFRVGGDVDHNGLPDIALVDEEGSWPGYRNHLRCFRETSSPLALTARVVEPSANDRWLDGSVRFIDWAIARPGVVSARVRLELSTNGDDGPWALIADDLPDSGRYQWVVSAEDPSSDCRIRIHAQAGALSAESISAPFTILPPGTVDVPVTGVPAAWSLAAGPNPSDGGVWLRWSAPGSGPLELAVFDITGRRVAGAIEPGARAGSGRWFWDTRDLADRLVPDGVYFARLHGDESTTSLRLVIRR